MPEPKISAEQLRRLQTLWGQYARHELLTNSREQRLTWASSVARRKVDSFSNLTLGEASTLINLLQAEMGIAETSPPRRQRRYRSRIKDGQQARAAGTEGRKGQAGSVTMASAEDLRMLDVQLDEMGWTRDRLDKFLLSPSSPIGRREAPQLRTLADVNRVLWALKKIARRSKIAK